jgi:ClpP class serine protease
MWLLKQDTAAQLARLQRTLVIDAVRRAEFEARAEKREDGVDDEKEKPSASVERVMKTAGDVAEVAVRGVLTKNPSFLLWLMGVEQTTYSDITGALAKAGADPAIKSVVLNIDSPGGTVDGLFETLAAIQAFKKPISVLATQACSAAYAIAAVSGPITATGPAASFGSIGVAASFELDEDVVDLTSTEAPEKRPDVTTEEGKAVVIKYLDAIHALFVDAIAAGRDVKPDVVNSDFGRGSVLLAGDAQKRGMIDSIVTKKKSAPRAAGATETLEVSAEAEGVTMDLRKLKTEHYAIYEAAFAEGVAAEKDRCSAHLTMAQPGGEEGMAIALKAIAAGAATPDQKGMSMAEHASYMTVALNKRDRNARAADDKVIEDAASGATPKKTTEESDLGDKVVAIMRARRGQKVGG